MNVPDSCLRGLRKRDWVQEDGTVATEALMPDKNTGAERADGMIETSINWEDDEKAIEVLLTNRNGSAYGSARLETKHLQQAMKIPANVDMLSYERREENGNVYHGNILFSADAPPYRKRAVASFLAMVCAFVPRRQE